VVGFEVRDTGIGIAPEVQSQLFQPFVQAEQSTSRRFGGTGLGLAISAQLLQQMGSRIEVESAPGKGSNFHFKLRLEKGTPGAQPSWSDATAIDFSSIRALVVGDGEISRGVISQYLVSWGIANLSIASEESALNELRSASARNLNYAVVLLDQGPANKGLNLARFIKADAQLKQTQVIIMSSDSSSSESSEIVDAWLIKPVRPSILFNALHQLFPAKDGGNADVRAAKVGNPELAWRKDLRVLVVEDNLTNQILIKEQLAVLGYTVNLAGDARRALEFLAKNRYDAILMDCELPGMDGYQATAEIRRREGDGRQLKIVALTAHVADNQRQRCLDAGMDGYLSKPVKLRQFVEALDQCGRESCLRSYR
jgi:CheY-like chemotaxis protein